MNVEGRFFGRLKKIIILSVALIIIGIGFIFLKNYFYPNVEVALHNYKWMDHIQVLRTDWYGSDGITFFVTGSGGNQEFCKGFVSKSIIHTKTELEDCVPFTNTNKEGVVGTSRFKGKPLISGFTGAHTKVTLKGLKIRTITYKHLKAWYAFYDKNSPVQPTFQYETP
jgi:hypothetical protein